MYLHKVCLIGANVSLHHLLQNMLQNLAISFGITISYGKNILQYWYQLSGIIFGTFNLSFASTVLILKVSLKSLFGSSFCNVVPLAGCINLTGYIIWSSLVAIYRILYIKAQNWVKYRVGERRLLRYFIVLGLLLQTVLSIVIYYFDDESLVSKACNHFSAEDVEILQQYHVRITDNLRSGCR